MRHQVCRVRFRRDVHSGAGPISRENLAQRTERHDISKSLIDQLARLCHAVNREKLVVPDFFVLMLNIYIYRTYQRMFPVIYAFLDKKKFVTQLMTLMTYITRNLVIFNILLKILFRNLCFDIFKPKSFKFILYKSKPVNSH